MAGNIGFYNGNEKARSGQKSFAITKSDTDDFSFLVRGIYVGGAGNVVVVNADDSTCTYTSVPAGTLLPVVARRVNSSSTTATNMVGLY